MSPAEERAALLAGVLAAPADDAPRLVFADWCDDNGEVDRAELIRREVQWHRAVDAGVRPCGHPTTWFGGACDGCNIDMELRALWAKHRRTRSIRVTLDEEFVVQRHHSHPWDWMRRRGFVSEISLSFPDFERYAGALFATQPIATVRLRDRSPSSWTVNMIDGWCWAAERPMLRALPAENNLPSAIYSRLTGGRSYVSFRWYEHHKDAIEAVSKVLVLLGREEASKRLAADEGRG